MALNSGTENKHLDLRSAGASLARCAFAKSPEPYMAKMIKVVGDAMKVIEALMT